jgi:ribosomal protein S20
MSAVSAADPTAPPAPAATEAPTATPAPATGARPGPDREVGEYCQAFRAAFAANLGKTEDEVIAAAKAATNAVVDQMVKDGKLATEHADKLKTRVAAAPAEGCAPLRGFHWKVAKAAIGLARDGFTAAADALQLTPAELRTQLKAGKDLKAIAEAQHVHYDQVSAAITAAVKADLDQAVAKGMITQHRADRILDRLAQRLADGTWRIKGKP